MPEAVVATMEEAIASPNEESTRGNCSKRKKKGHFITRITALVAAPTGVADRWGRGTWRDILVESSRRGIFRRMQVAQAAAGASA